MIRIVADTTCALPLDMLHARDIPVLPQYIIFGEESFRDDHELKAEDFFRKLRASAELPKTAAPPPALYEPVFRRLLERGDEPLVICPSADVSGTYRAATVAAEGFPGSPISVVDMRTIGGMLGAAVQLADRWAREGVPLDTLLARLENLRRLQRTYFVVDTLEFLHRGGRIGGARRLLGEMLQVKPILRLQDGRVEAYEQPRTKRKALQRLKELVKADCPPDDGTFLCVMHADAKDAAAELRAELQVSLAVREAPLYELPPAIAVHAGPGVLAVGFFAGKELAEV